MHYLPYTATLFQLRLSGVRSCQEWVVSTHISDNEVFKGQNLFFKASHLLLFVFHGSNNPLTSEAYFRDQCCFS